MLDANGVDVDAIVRVGVDLACARLTAGRAVAGQTRRVNGRGAAWHTLRKLHITDQLQGFGFLLRQH